MVLVMKMLLVFEMQTLLGMPMGGQMLAMLVLMKVEGLVEKLVTPLVEELVAVLVLMKIEKLKIE